MSRFWGLLDVGEGWGSTPLTEVFICISLVYLARPTNSSLLLGIYSGPDKCLLP